MNKKCFYSTPLQKLPKVSSGVKINVYIYVTVLNSLFLNPFIDYFVVKIPDLTLIPTCKECYVRNKD